MNRVKDKSMFIPIAIVAAMAAAIYLAWDSRQTRKPAADTTTIQQAEQPQLAEPTVEATGVTFIPRRIFTRADYASYDIFPSLASFQDFLQGGCIIFGETGSGKSSGPYRTAVRSLLAHPSRPGFLVMAAKESVWGEWVQHTRHTNRSNDLVRFGPGETCDFRFIRLRRAPGVELGGHADSTWSCVKGLQDGGAACPPVCCITPSACAAIAMRGRIIEAAT